MTGIQNVKFRIPEEWDPAWFEQVFIRQVLQFADARNIVGTGLTITGDLDEPAAIVVDDVGLDGLDDIETSTFLGRVSAGTGEVESLSTAQTTSLIDLATDTQKGVVLKASAVTNANASAVDIAGADAAAQTGSYVQADVQSIATLVNELKADVNTLVTDLNAIKDQLNAKMAADRTAGQMLS